MELNSCLYETNIMHCRIRPKRHKFNHRVFMFYLDLDEIDVLSNRLKMLGHNQPKVYNFRDDDHFRVDGLKIKEKVLRFLEENEVKQEIGKIMLLTNLRTFGYIFNPVSFYFCFDVSNRPLCVVPEIGNTFGEIKPFFIGCESFSRDRFVCQLKKYFYISPFVDLDVSMDMNLVIPDKQLNIKIDDFDVNGKFIYTVMSGQKMELTDKTLLKVTLKYPFVTLKTIFLIHLHALLLWFKKVPFHAKEKNSHLQKEVYRVWNNGQRSG